MTPFEKWLEEQVKSAQVDSDYSGILNQYDQGRVDAYTHVLHKIRGGG